MASMKRSFVPTTSAVVVAAAAIMVTMTTSSKTTFAASAEEVLFSPSNSALQYSFYDDLRLSQTAVFEPLVGSSSVDADGDDSDVAAADAQHVGRNLHSVSNVPAEPDADGTSANPEARENDDDSTAITLCHVPTFFRWSQASSGAPGGYNDVSSEAYGGTAAALLAMHHFNNGIGTIAPDLADLHLTCPIRLTMETIDSQSSGIMAVQELTRLVTRSPSDVQRPQPCAIMGSSWSGTTKKMGTVSGVYDLMQITPSASSVSLDNMGEYPLFTRTHPSDASMAELSVDYLHNILGVKFFAQLYIDNDFGSSYHTAVINRAAEYDMVVKSVPFRPGAELDEIEVALNQLKDTGYNYFMGIFFSGDYERIMDLAVDVGVAGPGRFWMFNGALSSVFVNGVSSFGADSNTAKVTYGSAIVHDEGGLPGLPQFDKFLAEWRSIPDDSELLRYINSKQPLPPPGSDLDFERDGEFFLQNPSHIAAFSYDAIVGLGLSACKALDAWDTKDDGDSKVFSGAEHHSVFVQNGFLGASGENDIGPNTYSRNATATYHVMSNILPMGETDEDGMQTFKAYPKVLYNTVTKQWTPYGDSQEFVFSDGSTTPPPEIPVLDHNMNQLQPGVRAACLALSGIAMILSIGFLVFTSITREKQVIKASQPHFLIMLCIGCLLMASCIIPAAMDDAVASTYGCDIACMSKIWLFAIGFCVCFSALFSKTYRINKLFKNAKGFKRVKVTMKDVIGPFFVLLAANIIVLITWQAYAPLQWERTVLEYDDYGRPMSSIGTCASDTAAPFLWTLVVINGAAVILALWQAYQARNITTEFSESKYIAIALVFIFQSLFIGVPILIIVNGQPTPELFVLSAIVFIIVVAMLLLIFLPKIAIMRKGEEGLPSNYNPRGSTWMRSTMSTTSRRGTSVRESSIQKISQAQSILRSVGPSVAEGNSSRSTFVSVGTGDAGSASKGVSFGSQVVFVNDSMEDELKNYGNDSDELPLQDEEKAKEIDATGEDAIESHPTEDANCENASDELPLQDEKKPDESDVTDEDWQENHGHEPVKQKEKLPVLT